MAISVLRGKGGFKAITKAGQIVYTGDKNATEGDLAIAIEQHAQGGDIKDVTVEFACLADMVAGLVPDDKPPSKKRKPKEGMNPHFKPEDSPSQ